MRVQIFDGIQILLASPAGKTNAVTVSNSGDSTFFTSSRYSSETVLSVTMQAFFAGSFKFSTQPARRS